MDNPYVRLTHEFNAGRLRAILASGQAVVLYRLAITSKDGDWILREDEESLAHVIETLARHGARYRFGAPLDLRWMAHGWSSHRDEFLSEEDLDIRNLSDQELELQWRLWLTQAQASNDLDRARYSHGVFVRDPAVPD